MTVASQILMIVDVLYGRHESVDLDGVVALLEERYGDTWQCRAMISGDNELVRDQLEFLRCVVKKDGRYRLDSSIDPPSIPLDYGTNQLLRTYFKERAAREPPRSGD